MKEQMRKQHAQSDYEGEQMAFDRKNILQEQKRLWLLNQQLFKTIQCNRRVIWEQQVSQPPHPRRTDPEADQIGQITAVPYSDCQDPLVSHLQIQECKLSKKLSTLTFDYYSGVSDPV